MPAGNVALIDRLKAEYPHRSEKELLALIMRGDVHVDGRRIEKPGTRVDRASAIALRGRPAYASRGGEKLAYALERWRIDCRGVTWIDAGCSTGGFTDCLLSQGAALVHAVDVGTNQLDWRLRTDPRVRAREGTNVMRLTVKDLDPTPDRAVADLSFRSLRRAASHILGLTGEGWGIFLAKPQFEWSRPPRDFRGVVNDPRTVVFIVNELIEGLASEDIRVQKALVSPIRGRKGNIELLFLLRAGRKQRGDITRRRLEELVLGHAG